MQILLHSQPEAARKPKTIHQILHQHFFRRFFDNDTLSTEGETQTTVIRALCAFAVPGLMVAFWLLPSYPGVPERNLWAIAADRYFFVLYSFVCMGAVATFQWEMLFPDRADFLILLPLPLKRGQLFLAKGRALITFLGMFLAAANLFALILFPAVSTKGNASYLHTVIAHFAAVTLAGTFAAATMLAIAAIAICLLPLSWFRAISPILQALSITALLLLLLLFPLITTHLQPLLAHPNTIVQSMPPLWFLSLYERLSLGESAPAACQSLAQTGLIATAIAATLAIAAYPLAWQRQKKRALEGTSHSHRQSCGPVSAILHRTLLRQPQQRAAFHFLTQTITRFLRYQVYLAIYSGIGLALALCSFLTIAESAGKTLALTLWTPGLHAVLPLVLFWMVLGLKSAFAFPADMQARWVFPINLPLQSPSADQAAQAAKTFVLLACTLLTLANLAFLLALQWSYWALAIQAFSGIGLSLLLANLFFLGRNRIPFTRPRLPGRTNLPILFVLYAAIFPAIVLSTVHLELQLEREGALLSRTLLIAAALLILLKIADHLAKKGIIADLAEDEDQEGPQTLGLSQ
jgi:hypothetical protein